MNNNASLEVEIEGHTDNVGAESHNHKLSENRAKAVYDFLVENGISANRMTFKGFGASQPIATNDTDEGRATNRRTAFRVIWESGLLILTDLTRDRISHYKLNVD